MIRTPAKITGGSQDHLTSLFCSLSLSPSPLLCIVEEKTCIDVLEQVMNPYHTLLRQSYDLGLVGKALRLEDTKKALEQRAVWRNGLKYAQVHECTPYTLTVDTFPTRFWHRRDSDALLPSTRETRPRENSITCGKYTIKYKTDVLGWYCLHDVTAHLKEDGRHHLLCKHLQRSQHTESKATVLSFNHPSHQVTADYTLEERPEQNVFIIRRKKRPFNITMSRFRNRPTQKSIIFDPPNL